MVKYPISPESPKKSNAMTKRKVNASEINACEKNENNIWKTCALNKTSTKNRYIQLLETKSPAIYPVKWSAIKSIPVNIAKAATVRGRENLHGRHIIILTVEKTAISNMMCSMLLHSPFARRPAFTMYSIYLSQKPA